MCWQIYMRIATAFVCMCAFAHEWHNSFKTICKDLYLLKTRIGMNEWIEKKNTVFMGYPWGVNKYHGSSTLFFHMTASNINMKRERGKSQKNMGHFLELF